MAFGVQGFLGLWVFRFRIKGFGVGFGVKGFAVQDLGLTGEMKARSYDVTPK